MTTWTSEQFSEYLAKIRDGELKRIGDEVKKEKAKIKQSVKISEAMIKKAVADYLGMGMAQGKWWYTRLNSGGVLQSYTTKAGEVKKYKVNMCEPGTADFVVVEIAGEGNYANLQIVTYIETKCKKGKQSDEQIAFQRQVEALGCKYMLVRDVQQVIDWLE